MVEIRLRMVINVIIIDTFFLTLRFYNSNALNYCNRNYRLDPNFGMKITHQKI